MAWEQLICLTEVLYRVLCLYEEMATHGSILAWKIPWTEEPDGLQSRASQRVGHDRATKHICVYGCTSNVSLAFTFQFQDQCL